MAENCYKGGENIVRGMTRCPQDSESAADTMSSSSSGDSVDASSCENIPQIIIPVAGTTDPVNTNDGDNGRAVSYVNGASIRYWHQCFAEGLKKLADANGDIAIFSFHGWTGDNRIRNREIAGAYLVNRLCGAEGQNAFYSGYLNQEVHFHLIGHSHGGNVMNEMTKQIARLGGQWPAKWKIKSMVYLSTPFFNTIHQINVSDAFHADAKVLSAYNDYDLTQRMMADFSMEPLASAVHSLDFSQIKRAADQLSASIEAVPFENLKEVRFAVGGARLMNHEAGAELYNRTIDALTSFKYLLISSLQIIEELNKEYEYDKDTQIQSASGEQISNSRKLISDSVYNQFKGLFDTLHNDVDVILRSLLSYVAARTRDGRTFDKFHYIESLFGAVDFLNHLAQLLDINSVTLMSTNRPSLWSLLAQVLQENIDLFDNTVTTPEQQLNGTSLAGKIEYLNVTDRDLYYGSMGSMRYAAFILQIEVAENSYNANPSATNLLNLLFILISNADIAYEKIMEFTDYSDTINYLEYVATGNTDTLLKRVKAILINIRTIVQSRHVGSLLDERDPKTEYMETRGNLMYLLEHSHSTSRHCMHKEVKAFLEKQTSC